MRTHLFALLLILGSVNANAAQSLSTKVSNQYNSLRAMGMGNAFTAVADDYSLIYYNPAGFARKPYNEVQFSLVGAGVSAKTMTVAKDINDAGNIAGTDNDKAQAISDVLDKYYGQSLGGKVQALELFWVRKGWGFAFTPFDLTLDMTVNRQLGPALDLNIKGDTAFAFGYGRPINNEFDAGISAKFLHRVAVEQSLSALELSTDPDVLSDKRFKEGVATDFDLGFMWTPGWFAKGTTSEATTEVKKAVDAEKPPETIDPNAKPKDETGDKAEPGADKKPEDDRKPQAEEDPAKAATDDKAKDDKKSEDGKTSEAQAEIAPVEPVVKLGEENPKAEKDLAKIENATSKLNSGAGYPLTLGMTVQNVLSGSFSKSTAVNKSATEVPSKLERVINVGAQYRIVNGEDFKIRLLSDVRNILYPGITTNKMLHFGVELDYSPSGWFRAQARAGLNQGYFTAGTTLLLGIINIDLVTYGEEIGSASSKIENRVMALKLGFNF